MEFNKDVDDSSNLLPMKVAELEKANEDLKRAKDDAMQSWLDSRPLVDELEKLQTELAIAKAGALKSNAAISELQAQLGTMDMCIKSEKEEEQRFQLAINENNQSLHRMHEEIELLKVKIAEKNRKKMKLKVVLQSKKQTLKALQLIYEATLMETEVFRTSTAKAHGYIENSEAANVMVHVPREMYESLKRETNEQNSLEEWRISVAAEEKDVAKRNRNAALRRLKNLHPHSVQNGAEQRRYAKRIEAMADTKAHPKPTRVVHRRNAQQQFTRRNYNNSERKSSIFFRIKALLSKYFN